MNVYDIIRHYGKGKGEESMWKAVRAISAYIENNNAPDSPSLAELEKCLYAILNGEHFDEQYGREQIDNMYYIDHKGVKHIAPFWTDEEMHDVYEQVKGIIPASYTEWDFFVTLNMMRADFSNILKEWFAGDEADMTRRSTELAVAWLNDVDSPHKTDKVWHYFA